MLDEQHTHVALVGQPADEAARARRSRSRRARRRARRASRSTAPTRPFVRCRRAGDGRTGAPRASCRGSGSSSNSCTAATAVDGRAWWPGQNRSVTHEAREACWSLPARMFSSTLMSSNSSSDWNERRSPSRRAASRSSRRCGDHRARSLLAVTGTKPVTASMSVVLPAPLGPIRPTTSPGRTSIDTSSTAIDRTEADGQAHDRQRRRPRPARPRPDGRGARSGRRATRWSVSQHRTRRGHGDVGDAVLVDDEDHEHDREPMMRSHWSLRLTSRR